MVLTRISGPQWSLVTPLEWTLSGFDIEFKEGPERKTDSELEALIDEHWSGLQSRRHALGMREEKPWPKTGYRSHYLDHKRKVLVIRYSPANWKANLGTNHNPEFFRVLLSRYNHKRRKNLELAEALTDKSFQRFALQHLDGSMSQCAAVETSQGYIVGHRSSDVGVEPDIDHVLGGYLPGIGRGIYKVAVPKIDGSPIVEVEVFGPNHESLVANALVNLYQETGGQLNPRTTQVRYTGLIMESNLSTQFLSMATSTGIVGSGRNWENREGSMRYYKPDDIPAYVNKPEMVAGGLLRSGQACLVAAYVREKRLFGVGQFPFLTVRIGNIIT